MRRRGIFDPLRPRARDVVRFHERFPAVLELVGDPAGGIWIRQTTAGSGEVWVYRGVDGSERGSVRLPAGRHLLRVAEEALVAFAINEYEVEQIEVYARPPWAVRRWAVARKWIATAYNEALHLTACFAARRLTPVH
jgi:hypothetical protein